MSWTDIYPVMLDEMVNQDFSNLDKLASENWFGIEKVYFTKIEPKHIVATSLFWKRDFLIEDDLPVITRKSMINAENMGLSGRYSPWNNYVLPLIKCATFLKKKRPDVVLRVYLANDLFFLIDDLTDVGCEVYLMKSSSIRHNPGAMWRFLALEEASETCSVTVMDSDRLKDVVYDLARTEASQKVGVGGWRVPYDCKGSSLEGYRPMSAAQFGGTKHYPMRQLMEAFILHNLNGTMPTKIKLEGLRENRIVGTTWPDYGFDEWFLLAVMYPRMAHEGLLTFFPWDKETPGQFYTLDIEYCTWANPKSELINYPNPETGLGDVIRPWAEWKDQNEVRVRPHALLAHRARKKIGPIHTIDKHTEASRREAFSNASGDLQSLLTWTSSSMTEPWWIDLNPHLLMAGEGSELFLDRRYEEVDVVFCGNYFIKITAAIASWTRDQKLDVEVWGEGKLLKVPKLEGPMTLWRTDFCRKFHEELVAQIQFVKAEILMRAWMDQGKVRTAETTAKQMGWKVR